MADQRLPIVNSDDGTWGDIIRQYLMKEHFNDDTNNAANGGHQKITIRPGTTAAGTAPLKFTSGALMNTPEAGAVEFNNDSLYITQTTSTARKKIAAYDPTGATGDIYYRDSNGYFTRLAAGSTGNLLTITSGIPSWTSAITGSTLDNTSTITIKDASFTLQDDGDTTKQARFQLSGITTGTTRTYTLPDASTTLLDADTDQVIGGVKELTSMFYTREIWVQPTAGPGNTAAVTLDNANGQIWQHTNNSGGAWALWDQTNSKAPIAVQANAPDQALVINGGGVFVDDSRFSINNLTDNSKQAQFDASLITTGTSRSFKLPDATTTLVGTDATQVLTNKTLTNPRINNINDTNGNAVLGLYAITSAVNYFYMTNQSAGNYPTIGVDGSGTNIGIAIAPKGNGPIRIFTASGQVPTLEGIDGSGNTDLNLKSNGTGKVKANNIEVATISGSQTLSGKTLTNPTVNNYTEGVVVIGTVTTASTLDLTNGTVQTATLTASTACTFTMPTVGAGKSFVLFLKQAATTGLGTATFTGVKWPGGTAPTITPTAAQMDILTFTSDDTNWYGTFIQGFTP